jgi:hypothetical protein
LGKGAGDGGSKAGLFATNMKSEMNKTNVPESRSFMEIRLPYLG